MASDGLRLVIFLALAAFRVALNVAILARLVFRWRFITEPLGLFCLVMIAKLERTERGIGTASTRED